MKKRAKRTIMVNLWGGPGTGKSTLMADVFAELKWRGVDCEQAPEFAKEKVWESTDSELDEQIVPPALRCQPYIFWKATLYPIPFEREGGRHYYGQPLVAVVDLREARAKRVWGLCPSLFQVVQQSEFLLRSFEKIQP